MQGSKDVAAVLLVIDKVYARKETLTVPVETVGTFEDLDILVKRCMTNQNDLPPRYAALLEIHDRESGRGRERLFSGWMFDSSPSLSALEHPYFDIAILRCETLKTDEKDEKKSTAKKEKTS